MQTELEFRNEAFQNFVALQVMNAIPAKIFNPIGTRERVIYFIFVENAAFECLSGQMPDEEIQSFVLNDIFGKGWYYEELEVTMFEKILASQLMAKMDCEAIEICKASTMALSHFLDGDESTNRTLLGLISNLELLENI